MGAMAMGDTNEEWLQSMESSILSLCVGEFPSEPVGTRLAFQAQTQFDGNAPEFVPRATGTPVRHTRVPPRGHLSLTVRTSNLGHGGEVLTHSPVSSIPAVSPTTTSPPPCRRIVPNRTYACLPGVTAIPSQPREPMRASYSALPSAAEAHSHRQAFHGDRGGGGRRGAGSRRRGGGRGWDDASTGRRLESLMTAVDSPPATPASGRRSAASHSAAAAGGGRYAQLTFKRGRTAWYVFGTARSILGGGGPPAALCPREIPSPSSDSPPRSPAYRGGGGAACAEDEVTSRESPVGAASPPPPLPASSACWDETLLTAAVGDVAVVDGDRGYHAGRISRLSDTPLGPVAGTLWRVATKAEREALTELPAAEQRAVRHVQGVAQRMGLDIVVVDCELQLDWRKLTVYYAARERVDFNALVRALYSRFHARIWLERVPHPSTHPTGGVPPAVDTRDSIGGPPPADLFLPPPVVGEAKLPRAPVLRCPLPLSPAGAPVGKPLRGRPPECDIEPPLLVGVEGGVSPLAGGEESPLLGSGVYD